MFKIKCSSISCMSESLKQSVAISGSNGFVGKNLLKFLTNKKLKCTPISRSIFQETKPPLISKCFCFVHLVGLGNETKDASFEQVNVDMTKKAIDICKKSKIKKIIYFSGLGVSSKSTSNYFISKFKAERLIIKSGLDYTIFRPSYIIGKDDYLTKNLQKQIKKKKIIIPGTGSYIIQPISIKDVCNVMYFTINSTNFSKKIIDLVGPEKITFRQFIKNSTRNSKTEIEKIPLKKSLDSVLYDKKFPYGIEDLNILFGNFEGNHDKLKKISKIEFTKIKSI